MLASASVTLPVLHEMPLGLTTEPSVSTQSVKSWLPGVVAQLPTSTPRPVSFVTQGGTEVYVTSKRTTETPARSRAWEVPKGKPLSVDEANATDGSHMLAIHCKEMSTPQSTRHQSTPPTTLPRP